MRRLSLTLTAVGLSLMFVLHAWAGDEADDILAKAVQAHYPKGRNDSFKAFQSKNKGMIYVQGLELEFTQEVSVMQPGKFKEVMDLTVMNTAVKTTTVFDGKDGWIKVNDMDIPVKDELLEEFKAMGYMIGLSQLRGFKEQGVKLSLLGEVQVNGKPAVGIKLSKEGKKDIDLYFDKATGLMAKTERRTRDFQSGQEVTEERIVTEYQDAAGQKTPKKVQVNRDGKKLLEVEVIEARNLEKLDDSEFAKP